MSHYSWTKTFIKILRPSIEICNGEMHVGYNRGGYQAKSCQVDHRANYKETASCGGQSAIERPQSLWPSIIIPSDNVKGVPDSMLRVAIYARISTTDKGRTQRISFASFGHSSPTRHWKAGPPPASTSIRPAARPRTAPSSSGCSGTPPSGSSTSCCSGRSIVSQGKVSWRRSSTSSG